MPTALNPPGFDNARTDSTKSNTPIEVSFGEPTIVKKPERVYQAPSGVLMQLALAQWRGAERNRSERE